MRVVRGKTFESKQGVWEKIEVELNEDDLLPEEQAAPDQVKLQLLEVRADKHLLLFLNRANQISKEEAKAQLKSLNDYRDRLLKVKPLTPLRPRKRKVNED